MTVYSSDVGSWGEDKPAPLPNIEAVDELCTFLGKRTLDKLELDKRQLDPRSPHYHEATQLPKLKFNDGGFTRLAITREDFQRLLPSRKRELSDFMITLPRNEAESIADYAERVQLHARGRTRIDFAYIGNVVAHIMRVEREEDDARRRKVDEDKAEERERHAELVEQSTPDRERIRELLTIIERGEEGEKLLNQIGAALGRHRKAEEARKKLRDIFEAQTSACNALGKRVPTQMTVPKAPDGALEFAAVVARASAPPPRIYPARRS